MSELDSSWLPAFHRFSLLTAHECKQIIAHAEERNRYRPAEIIYPDQRVVVERDHARMDVMGNGPGSFVYDLVAPKIEKNLHEINRRFLFDLYNDPTERLNRVVVNRYRSEDRAMFRPHVDLGNAPEIHTRKLTVVVVLSNPDKDFKGGRLRMHRGEVYDALDGAKRGDAIVFPSFMMHSVTPVTEGNRFVLTMWLHGPKIR